VQEGLEVSVEEFASESKAKMAFDADVASYGILPLLVRVDNSGSQNYTVLRSDIKVYLDGQLLSPIMSNEAAKEAGTREYAGKALGWTVATGPFFIFLWPATIAGSAAHTQSVNKRIVQHFENLAFNDARLKPNQTAAGFVYFKLPDGVEQIKNLTVEVQPSDDKTGKRLTYKLNVKGLSVGTGAAGAGTATQTPEAAIAPKVEQGSGQPSQKLETAYATKTPAYKGDWSLVQAPVYKEGDWWVFQVKEEGKRPWNARVTYKDGKFESDDPAFLRGEDIPDAPSFLPFASVYLNDPQKKWLDFPLVRGKKWSFRYLYEWAPAGNTYTIWGIAEAEVMGTVAQQMKTPAGSFRLIKILRTDWLVRGRRADLTYFYSPETKSVVKLTANAIDRGGTPFGLFN